MTMFANAEIIVLSAQRKEHLMKHRDAVHGGMKYKCQVCGKEISRYNITMSYMN